jgi:hypothetical protein
MKSRMRWMLPDFRLGRGKLALARVKCYGAVPEEFAKEKMIRVETKLPKQSITLAEVKKLM